MLRKLTAIAAGVTAGLVVLSAFAQTTTPPKKKKKHKHPTTAPAASASAAPAPAAAAPAASAHASPELYKPPAEEETPAPAPSAAPATEGAAKESEPAAPAVGDKASEGTEAPTKASGDASSLRPLSVAILGGWGFDAAAKLGFGARVGYTLPFHVYIGGTFVYHLGETEYGDSANFFYPGGEVGYELSLGPLLVRPYVGVGPLVLHASVPPVSESRMYFAFWPGATVAFSITPMFFVGADVHYIVSSYDIFGFFATAGARF